MNPVPMPILKRELFFKLATSSKLGAEASDLGFGIDPYMWPREFELDFTTFDGERNGWLHVHYTMIGILEKNENSDSATYECLGASGMFAPLKIVIFND